MRRAWARLVPAQRAHVSSTRVANSATFEDCARPCDHGGAPTVRFSCVVPRRLACLPGDRSALEQTERIRASRPPERLRSSAPPGRSSRSASRPSTTRKACADLRERSQPPPPGGTAGHSGHTDRRKDAVVLASQAWAPSRRTPRSAGLFAVKSRRRIPGIQEWLAWSRFSNANGPALVWHRSPA